MNRSKASLKYLRWEFKRVVALKRQPPSSINFPLPIQGKGEQGVGLYRLYQGWRVGIDKVKKRSVSFKKLNSAGTSLRKAVGWLFHPQDGFSQVPGVIVEVKSLADGNQLAVLDADFAEKFYSTY